jgi:uncharacterized protein (TIGR03435 family)
MRIFASASFSATLASVVWGQAATPAFDLADVHPSAKGGNQYMSGGVLRGARYDIRNATMLDLIQTAYSIDDTSKIVGGPNWLNTDRFDIAAKAPPAAPQDTLKLMLEALLADRFKLMVHMDKRPLQAYVLSVGKGKPKMKEATESGDSGCQFQQPKADAGAAGYQTYTCKNTTMEMFAQQIRRMAAGYVTDLVVDQTNLQGAWDFDIKWTGRGQLALAGADGISLFDAVDKQLGLKLEPQRVTMPVTVVDSVNQKPTENPPGVTTNLPPPPPAEFEVASIRPSAPGTTGQNGRVQNDRLDLQGWTLKSLITTAWNINNDDLLAGGPKFLETTRFDVVAKAPSAQIDFDELLLMMRALLVDRFKLATHTETRTVNVYTLTAAKPKLTKADPQNRSECKNGPGADGKDPRITNPILNRLVTCHNVTMAQLAEEFQNFAGGYLQYSVVDATGLEGAYDLTLSFSGVNIVRNGGGRGGDAGTNSSDPSGALSLYDAVNKQLGLKLEQQKRPVPVLVIDHVEEKPTDN